MAQRFLRFPRAVSPPTPSVLGDTLTFPFRFSRDLTPVDGLWNPFHQCVNALYSAFSYISARFNRLTTDQTSVRDKVHELRESVKSLETSRGDHDLRLQTLENSSISLQRLAPSDVGLGRVSETLDRLDHLINGLQTARDDFSAECSSLRADLRALQARVDELSRE